MKKAKIRRPQHRSQRVAAKFELVVTNEWSKKIDKVLGVYKTNNGKLEVEYLTSDGKKAVCDSGVIHIKAPIKLWSSMRKI